VSDVTDAARRGVAAVATALGLKPTPGHEADFAASLEVAAEAVVGLIAVIGGAAQKRATAAGIAAAAAVTTVEQANAVMEAAAAAVEPK
jgi:hypothetical protein